MNIFKSSMTHLMEANVSQVKFRFGDLCREAQGLCETNASHPVIVAAAIVGGRQKNSLEKEQLCVLIDHTTSSTQLVLSHQDVLSVLGCIKSLSPTEQLEEDVRYKVTSAD